MSPRRELAAVVGCIAVAGAAGGAQAAYGSLNGNSWPLTITGPRLDYERPFGRSAEGRELVVSASGEQRVRHKVLVVGCIHGTECAGTPIADAVLRTGTGCPPAGADVWSVPDLNPDGHRLGTRVNARGVDLNRNFAGGWRRIGARGDPQYSGPRPFSEPETRAARRLIRLVRPSVTIWYHQGQGPLVRAWGQSVPAARLYARRAGLPFRAQPWMAGTAPHWQNLAFPGTSSFVVELPDGKLSAHELRRQAAAVMALARHRGEKARSLGAWTRGGR
jgi:murein peptide amidase A